MSISKYLRKYENYVNDNPQGYWFRRKPYGWGWTPATWQGHAVTLGVVGLFLGIVFTAPPELTGKEAVLRIVLPVLGLSGAFGLILFTRGESPRWEWGIAEEYDRPVDRTKSRIGRFNIDFTIALIVFIIVVVIGQFLTTN